MKKLLCMLLLLSMCVSMLSLAVLAEDVAVPPAEGLLEPAPVEETEPEAPAEEAPAEPEEAPVELVSEEATAADADSMTNDTRENAGGDGKYRTPETPAAALQAAAEADGYENIRGYYLELDRSELKGPSSDQTVFTFLLDRPEGLDTDSCRVYFLNGETAEVMADVTFGPAIELNGIAPENGMHVALAFNGTSDYDPAGPGRPEAEYQVVKGVPPAEEEKLGDRVRQISQDYTDRVTFFTVTLVRTATGGIMDEQAVLDWLKPGDGFMQTVNFPVEYSGNEIAAVYMGADGSVRDIGPKREMNDYGTQGIGPDGCAAIDLGVSPDKLSDSFFGTMYFAVGVRDTGSSGEPSGPAVYPVIYSETPAQLLAEQAKQDGFEHMAGYMLTHNKDYDGDSSGSIGEGTNMIGFPPGMDYTIQDYRIYQLYDGVVSAADTEVQPWGILFRVTDVELGRRDGEYYGPEFVVAWNGTAGDVIQVFSGEMYLDNTLRAEVVKAGFDQSCSYAVETMDGVTFAADDYDIVRLWCPVDMEPEKPYRLFMLTDSGVVDVTDKAVLEQHKMMMALALSGVELKNDMHLSLAFNGAEQANRDLTGDGKVNRQDRVYLSRALAGWESYPMPEGLKADFNNDGKINRQDRVYLGRALAGWEGYSI